VVGETLVGAVTLYSASGPRRTAKEVRTLELLLAPISLAIQQAMEFDRLKAASLSEALTALPNFATVAQLVTAPRSSGQTVYPMLVVFLDVDRLKTINEGFGTQVGDRVLMHVAQIIRSGLRSGDLLLRYAGDEFVVLLTDSDVSTAECVAVRLMESVASSSFVLSDGTALQVQLKSGYAIAPRDTESLEGLVRVARERALFGKGRQESQSVH
jgi:diguanylate cyclase (GGDEF)-like protein